MSDATTAWFRDAKFGLFIHYGLYSLLEAGEWVQFRQKVPLADYAKLADRFTAEKFDADQITDLACEARMKYVNLVTCHHDGFCLWDSDVEPFNSVQAAPSKRDLVAEVAEQCRKKGLGFFTYYTYALNWRHPYYVDNGRIDFARPHYAERPAEYRYRWLEDFAKYVEYIHAHIAELITRFHPAGVWFDIISAAHAMPDLIPVRQTYELVRRLQPGCLIAYKQGATGDEDFASCEFAAGSLEAMMREKYGEAAAQLAKHAWAVNRTKRNEVCATLAKNWGWAAGDVQKSPDEVWTMLANAAGKNCNLLLNVGPHPDGSIPPDAVTTLREMGKRIDREGFPQPPAEAGGPPMVSSLPV